MTLRSRPRFCEARLALVALSALIVAGAQTPAMAGETRIAVAANFIEAAEALAETFEQETGHETRLSFGSTGQIYAQIAHGAPFDIFLAADQARPAAAAQEGLGDETTLFTYALGQIVLYSAEGRGLVGPERLAVDDIDKLAIANPATAPYGAAAVETMKTLGVYDALKPKLVQGVNIAQAFQFVETRNADLGFVALSQVFANDAGAYWIVPSDYHAPIAQDALLLSRGRDSQAALDFLRFLSSPAARAIIVLHGYSVPD